MVTPASFRMNRNTLRTIRRLQSCFARLFPFPTSARIPRIGILKIRNSTTVDATKIILNIGVLLTMYVIFIQLGGTMTESFPLHGYFSSIILK